MPLESSHLSATPQNDVTGGNEMDRRPSRSGSPAAEFRRDYLVSMVRRLPPSGSPVVPGSTPVVAFGDPARAEIATLGINPSAKEFLNRGTLLSGDQRRLATLESLGAQRCDALTEDQIARVVAECACYFQRRPYRRWFDPLDTLLRESVQVSYYNQSACHLDLVQWATDPVWSAIRDARVRQQLLEDGVPHLQTQLTRENVRLVLLNGRQVITQVDRLGLTELQEVDRLPAGPVTYRLYAGTGNAVCWLGWSANLQSSWGISTAFKRHLATRIAEHAGRLLDEPTKLPIPSDATAPRYPPQGVRLDGKSQLVAELRQWLMESSAPTIGDVGAFGGRGWLLVHIGGHEVVLNADTKRAAVQDVVRAHDTDPSAPWRVVANRRGRINKVLPWSALDPLPGWYAYLTQPLQEEASI